MSKPFVLDAMRSAEIFGLPSLRIAVVERVLTNEGISSVKAMASSAAGTIREKLAGSRSATRPGGQAQAKDDNIVCCGDTWEQALSVLQKEIVRRELGDGFPVNPPTSDAIKEMLSGAKCPPDQVIAVLEPGMGIATVEKIAINAVMAGCMPEHLPVIISAVDALADPHINLRVKAMSTGPHAPCLIVSGPYAERIGMNSGVCMLGPGSPSFVNSVVGRAVRLVMQNIGMARPGEMDLDTIGSPAKYSLCFAEAQDERNPWPTIGERAGLGQECSTITLQFVYGIIDLHDFESKTPEGLIRTYASAARNAAVLTTGRWISGRGYNPASQMEEMEHNLLIVCPDHARVFAREGWDIGDIQRALYRASRISVEMVLNRMSADVIRSAHPELQWILDHPDLEIPVLERPECFSIVVAGGAAGRGAFLYGAGSPITKNIP